MSNYIILTDSASDINAVQEKEWGTPVFPMNYLVDNTSYCNNPDHSEFPISDFYVAVKNGAKVSTSAVNIGEFIDFFSTYLSQGTDIIYICFSSGLSVTYQNALNAANELLQDFPEIKITVIDSLCASFGQGLLVYLCSEKKKNGATYEQLCAYAEEIKHNVCHEFTVDDLGQLKRGGRISAAAAFFGSMLQIKPMLFVDEKGKLAAYEKVRSRRLALRKLADMTIGEINPDFDSPVFISHGDCIDDAEAIADMIKEKYPRVNIVINHIGPVIGAHSGYKTLATFCIGNGRGQARLSD